MALNCAAIPDGLMESELFGHRRGAFTGALEDNPGLFRAASGGVVFLEEIGDMPLAMQAKLLRAIEEREVTAVGDTRSHKVDVRLLSATNRDLRTAIADRSFREDLYYRLNAMTIRVPPLRQRREDIPSLAALFLERAAARHRKRIQIFEPDVLELLITAEWPGNVPAPKRSGTRGRAGARRRHYFAASFVARIGICDCQTRGCNWASQQRFTGGVDFAATGEIDVACRCARGLRAQRYCRTPRPA